MRHWLQLATRSWRTRSGRSALAVFAITLGVGVVVWVTGSYESVRRGVTNVVLDWIGRTHVVVESSTGVWGLFDEQVRDWIDEIPGIAHITMRTREYVQAAPAPRDNDAADTTEKRRPPDTFAGEPRIPRDDAFFRIEVAGILPDEEVIFRNYNIVEGRMLKGSDRRAAVVEAMLAKRLRVGVGDTMFLRDSEEPPGAPRPFTVVGILERRRASLNQALMAWVPLGEVQTLCSLPKRVKSIEIIAADASHENIRRIAAEARRIIESRREEITRRGDIAPSLEVRTTEAQTRKLGAAQGLLQFIMMLLACVVLLTAFFIIIATISMGVTERIAELGLLRCVGVTRWQLCGLIIVQALPLGVLGTLLGVPLGFALQSITMQFVPEYLGEFAVSMPGVVIAVVGGIGTTLLGAVFPAIRAFDVSPVEAARSPADPNIGRWVWLTTGLGVVFLIAQEMVKRSLSEAGTTAFDAQSLACVVLLYLGAALLTPMLVVALGRPAVRVSSRLLGLRHELIGDEVQKSPFRSASICSGLMVGLSLIVGLVVWGESVKAGWQFPKEFPDAILYFYDARPIEKVRELRKLDGVKSFTATDDFGFSLRPPGRRRGFLESLTVMETLQRFFAIDPVEGLKLVKLSFLEGDERAAVEKLKQGGHILVTREFASLHKKGVGDKVRLYVGEKRATFEVAGVIASPGLDIAVSFFNAESYFQAYSVGAVVGTLDDAKRLFNRSYGKLVLLNFSFDETEYGSTSPDLVPDFVPGEVNAPTGRPTFALTGNDPIPGSGPEIKLINEMLKRMDYPDRAFVTARELKQQIDRNITRVTLLLSAIPLVGLVVASLGLANLMAANVTSRSRHLAVLRAIGVTRGQLVRMIVGETLVLAMIGSALGLLLGFVLARTSNHMTELLSGFRPEFAIPWQLVAAGMGLATLLCLLAGLGPARYAGRTNIVAALQD